MINVRAAAGTGIAPAWVRMWSSALASRISSLPVRHFGYPGRLALLAALAFLPAVAYGSAGTSYRARNINGEAAPPPYGLRLDGFYDGNASNTVTFDFDEVYLDQYNDGTALLRGEISIAEYASTDPRQVADPDATSEGGSNYLLNVKFVQITDPAKLAGIEGYRSDWTYYDIDPTGIEIQRADGSNDSTHLWIYPADLSKPFRVGPGANGRNPHFGASGLLSFKHYKYGKAYGTGPGGYLKSSEFLMDLETSESLPCDSVKTVDNFTLEFMGVHYDYDAGTSRWEYELTWDGSPPELSHIIIELCKEISPYDLKAVYPSSGEIGRDGSTGLYGIKWDPPPHLQPGVPKRLSFTLKGLLAVESTGFFPKAAVNQNYAQICGPALDCSEVTQPCDQNLPPVVQAPPVPDPIRCVPVDGKVCISGWVVSDPEGGSLTFGTMGSGTFDPATGTFCKTVGAPGQYTMTLSATDECGGTTTKSLTFEVLRNDPPSVELSNDSLSVCGPDSVCIDFAAHDDDSSLVIVTSLGCIEGSRVCFFADTTGTYTVIVTATDDCGLKAADTALVTVGINQPPTIVVSCPNGPLTSSSSNPLLLLAGRCDETVYTCLDDSLVCLECRLFVDDPDSEDDVVVTLPDGVTWNPDNGRLCLVRPPAGEITLEFTATDSCGNTSTEVLLIEVIEAVPPTLEFSAPDTTLYLCNPDTSLCFTVTATGTQPVEIEVVDNPGSFDPSTGIFCFNPAEVCLGEGRMDTTICVVFRATNECGSVLDSLCITVISKPPPVVMWPPINPFALCAPAEICVGPVSITDPAGSPLTIEGIGAEYRDGFLCFTPTEPGHYYVGVLVTDTCGNEVSDSVLVEVLLNRAPQITGPLADSAGACGPSQICAGPYQMTDPDGDPLTILVSGGAVLNESGMLCFTASSTGTYPFQITASDSCGTTNFDLVVEVIASQPPELTFSSSDTTLILCNPDTSLCFTVTASGGDSVVIEEILNPGSFDPATGEFCFNPTEICFGGPGNPRCPKRDWSDTTICVVFRATNECGSVLDSLCITVMAKPLPVVMWPPINPVALCEPGDVCIGPVSITDPAGSPLTIEGVGAEYRDGFLCFTPAEPGSYYIGVVVTDTCGNIVSDSVLVEVQLNLPPVITGPVQDSAGTCGSTQVCVGPYQITDGNGDPLTIVVSGGAELNEAGMLCFTAQSTGSYPFQITAYDTCGSTIFNVLVNVTASRPPVWSHVADTSVSGCDLGDSICVSFSATDPDGDDVFYEAALVVEGQAPQFRPGSPFCFLPGNDGVYYVVVRASDGCSAPIEDTVQVDVSLNTPPELIFSMPDTVIYVCHPDTLICFTVRATDADGDQVTISEILNPGIFDQETGEVCFNPDSVCFERCNKIDTTFCLVFGVSDACGPEQVDSLCIQVVYNRKPSVTAPEPQTITLCAPGQVCVPGFVVSDPEGDPLDISVSSGATYEGGTVCFPAEEPGVYTLVLCATDACGREVCDTTQITVGINLPPVVTFGPDTTVILCQPGTVCVPMPVVSDPNGDIPLLQIEGATQSAGGLCFNATGAGHRNIIVRAVDSCGAFDADTIKVTVRVNATPRVMIRAADPLTLCDTDTTLCFGVMVSDLDGSPVSSLSLIKTDTRFWSLNGQTLCLDAAIALEGRTHGTFQAIVEAIDPCGAKGRDTLEVELSVNQPPFVQLPADSLMPFCEPGELCVGPIVYGDPDELATVLDVQGAVLVGDQLCVQVDHDSVFVIVATVLDSCGASAVDTLRLDVRLNRAPTVSLPDFNALLVCTLDTICVDGIEGLDPDSGRLPADLVSGPGTFDPATGRLCFLPVEDGTYQFTFSVNDLCETVTATWSVNVTTNERPVFVAVPETTFFACEPGDSLCLTFGAQDPDGDPIRYHLLSGAGQIDPISGLLCFATDTSGTYTFVVTASDSCGSSAPVTGIAQVGINAAPSLEFSSSDTALFLCNPDTVLCFTVTGSDPDGPAPEVVEILNPGEFNPLTGVFCFNPAEICFDMHPMMRDTTICIVFAAVDSCGARTVDSFCVQVTRNLPPMVNLGPDRSAALCLSGTVCIDLDSAVSDPDGGALDIQVQAPGYLHGSQACIDVTETGRVTLVVCATDTCGLSSCDTLNLDVFINNAPVVILPPDTSVVACVVEQVCVGPVQVYDPDFSDSLAISLSGGATLVDDRLCFSPQGDGQYTFVVTATDRCGVTASDSVTVTVESNQPPVLTFSSPDTSLSLCHSDTELCFQVVATDPDGEPIDIEEILVPGFFDPATGTFCFNPDSVCYDGFHADTTICVVFRATDACGASVTDSLCIELKANKAPEIQFSSSDTTLYVCNADTLLCFNISATDAEGDSVEIREIVNPGEFYPELGMFCFKPSSVCYPNLPCAEPPTCVIFEAEDECGNITRDTLCIEVFANAPPVVVVPGDTVTVIQCQPGDEVCVSPVYGMDLEDGELVVSAPGAEYSPLLNTLCFDADTTGLYQFLVTTTDGCNLVGSFELWVRVVGNVAPTLALPGDTIMSLCGADSVCVPVLITDPEDDWTVSQIIGPATFNRDTRTLCVAVGTSSPISVSLDIVDHCGVHASDEFTITPSINEPPTVVLPTDFTAQVCLPGPYCFGPVTILDPDSNLVGPPQVSGGTYDAVSGRICIDVTESGSHTVIVSVTDSCGASAADTVVVEVVLNRPPQTAFSSSDTSLYLCTADTTLCFTFGATDPDGDLVLLGEVLNPGTFDPLTGEFCFNPSDICFGGPNNRCPVKRTSYDTTICLIFSATDTCGAEVYDTLCVHVTANEPPVVIAPNDTSLLACGPGPFCLSPFAVSDANDLVDSLTITSSGPAHTFDPATGILCFSGGPGTYVFRVTATDQCGATAADSVVVTVAPNQPPVVTLPADFSIVACGTSPVCVNVSASDPDAGDQPTITAVLPGTLYYPATSSICFTPDTSGVYRVIARATDRCGLTDLDTVMVTVTRNLTPAWVVVPAIDTFFCAPPGSLCFSVTASDPESQQLIYRKLSGPGTIDSLTGRICFNPGTLPGTFSFIVTASDPCGTTIQDTASVNVRMNGAPVLAAMRDTLVKLCQSGPVCFPPVSATDPDGNSIIYTVLSGSGTLTNRVYCFNADTSGFYAIRIKATDPCGLADTVLFHASVTVNRPPTLALPSPATKFLCGPTEICQGGITASDVDGGPITIVKTAGPGTFNAAQGTLCFTPQSAGTYNFDFSATDTCGAQTTGRMTITVQFNRTPTLDVPPQVSTCRDSQVCIEVGAIDPDLGNRLTITQVSGPAGTFVPNPLSGPAPVSGDWCWTPTAPGTYLVVFRAADSCGASTVDTTRIDVSDFCDTLCFAASIPNICPDDQHPDRWLFQGVTHQFPVMVTPSRAVGAFDFLIGYDASALTVQNVTRGADISAWEFFTYRILDPDTDCSGLCPSGLLRIVGIADINNGVPISNPGQMQPSDAPKEYARITFQVSNDRTLGGQFVDVDFFWNDCGDNTFSSPQGDLYVASSIDPDTCVGAGAKEQIEACATFDGGGGCIPTAADIDDRGDLNLNGIGYEISDAVLFSNYHIFGPRVFDPDPIRQASQVAASDVNGDGTPLTVADLVYLIRVIVGLEEPIDPGGLRATTTPGSVALGWAQQDDEFSLQLEGSVATGALALDVRTERAPESVELADAARKAGMELLWHAEGDRLKILVYSMQAHALPTGTLSVVTVRGAGAVETVTSQASDERGATLVVTPRAQASLPVTFELDPNFPNPFNPETEIRFTLHQTASVSLTVYNVLGQEVACIVNRVELAAGVHRYRFEARDARGLQLASGVYMYRLTAGGHSETRKMLLLR